MTSARPYRRGMPVTRVLAILEENAGPQWDSVLLKLFVALMRSEQEQQPAGQVHTALA